MKWINKWTKEFFSSNNEKLNSGIAFTTVGSLVGLVAFCYYAFWLHKDIGSNSVYLLLGLLGGGGLVGTLAGRFGTNTKRIGQVEED